MKTYNNDEFVKMILQVGLSDKDTKTQLIDTEKAIDMIFESLIAHGFSGATLIPCRGFYTHENGDRVFEKSIRVEVYDFYKMFPALIEICDKLKIALNQESIVYGVSDCNTDIR